MNAPIVKVGKYYPHGYSETRLVFNTVASKYLAGAEYINVKITPNLVVIEPAKSGYSLSHDGNSRMANCNALTNRVAPGKYKMLKCGNGFAIRRYEPLEKGATK